jgi:hypothetical protein
MFLRKPQDADYIVGAFMSVLVNAVLYLLIEEYGSVGAAA